MPRKTTTLMLPLPVEIIEALGWSGFDFIDFAMEEMNASEIEYIRHRDDLVTDTIFTDFRITKHV